MAAKRKDIHCDDTGWTPCNAWCRHCGPYRVEYNNAAVKPFFVGPDGAQAGYAIATAPSPVRVTAPHPDHRRSEQARRRAREGES